MSSVKLVLTFPPRLISEPIVYRLVKEQDLKVNILRASITPDEAGHMVLELSGEKAQIDAGIALLDQSGVHAEPLSKDVVWREDLCVHCTACVTSCPTGALAVDRATMRVSFDEEKCIACELCLPVCSYKAMEMRF